MGDETPKDEFHFCAGCGILREPRRRILYALFMPVPMLVLLVVFFPLVSSAFRGPVLLLAAILAAEWGLFLALGGMGLLLSRWWICPECREARLTPLQSRRMARIDRTFRRVRWYLGVPAAFLALLVFVGGRSGPVRIMEAYSLFFALLMGFSFASAFRIDLPPRRGEFLRGFRARRERMRAERRERHSPR